MIYVGLESTGGYENNWYELFRKIQGIYNLQVARLNPLGVHNYAKPGSYCPSRESLIQLGGLLWSAQAAVEVCAVS